MRSAGRQFRQLTARARVQRLERQIQEGNENAVRETAKRIAHEGILELRFQKSQATRRYNARLLQRANVQRLIGFWFGELAAAELAGDFEEYARAIEGIEYESNRLISLI